jgi:hypothetical protein
VRQAPGFPCALCYQGPEFSHASGASRRENAESYLVVIACDKREAFAQGSDSDEAIHSFFCAAKWIASRSLSSGAHSRDPLARNDEPQPV